MIRNRLPVSLAGAVLLWLTLSGGSAPALELGGHNRDGVTVGVEVGVGWNKMKFTQDDQAGGLVDLETDNKGELAGGLNVGWARNDYLIGALGFYGWKESGWTSENNTLSASTIHILGELYFFPRGQGFWIKGGLGLATLDFTYDGVQRHTAQKSGWNFNAGTGYEFRATDTTAVGLAYDFRYLTLGDFEGLQNTRVYSSNVSVSIRYYMD